MAKIRTLVIEDNRILREGITALINTQRDVTVAAVSDGKDNIIEKARAIKPHLVLMDLGLGNKNSIEVLKSVKKELPSTKIVGIGLAPSQSGILEFVLAGAEGFILKNATVEDVLNTIRAVAAGEAVLPHTMTGSLFFQMTTLPRLKGKGDLRMAMRMTEREKEIITLIVEGLNNKQIAFNLNIAISTVKSHVHNILEKLALHSRIDIREYASDEMEF